MHENKVVQRSFVLVVTVGVALVAAGCSAGDPSGRGLELVMSKCTTCHSYERMTAAKHNRAGWVDTVARMRLAGAVMTDAEAVTIADYLSSSNSGK